MRTPVAVIFIWGAFTGYDVSKQGFRRKTIHAVKITVADGEDKSDKDSDGYDKHNLDHDQSDDDNNGKMK